MPRALTAGLLVAVALAVTWPARPAGAERGGPSPSGVRTIYLRDCAVCHGAAGEGTNRGPAVIGVGRASVDYQLTTGRMPLRDPDEEIRRRPPAYPPETIAALVDLTAGFGGGGPDLPEVRPGDVARGGELYRLQCAACHAWSGGGGALLFMGVPDLQRSTRLQVAEAVRVGPGTMPAFGEAALDAGELDDVVAYVTELHDPQDRGGEPLWHLGPLAEGGLAWVAGMGLLLVALRWIGEQG